MVVSGCSVVVGDCSRTFAQQIRAGPIRSAHSKPLAVEPCQAPVMLRFGLTLPVSTGITRRDSSVTSRPNFGHFAREPRPALVAAPWLRWILCEHGAFCVG